METVVEENSEDNHDNLVEGLNIGQGVAPHRPRLQAFLGT